MKIDYQKIDYVGYSKAKRERSPSAALPEPLRKVISSRWRGTTHVRRIIDKNYSPLLGTGSGVGVE